MSRILAERKQLTVNEFGDYFTFHINDGFDDDDIYS